MKTFIFFLVSTMTAWGQVDSGELRLRIVDPSGAGVKVGVELISSGNGYDKRFVSDEAGVLSVKQIPFGVYRVEVQRAGFEKASRMVEMGSAIPVEVKVQLSIPSVVT